MQPFLWSRYTSAMPAAWHAVWGSAGRGISQVRGWQHGPVPPCPEMSVNVHLYAFFDSTARSEHHSLACTGSLQAAAEASGIHEKRCGGGCEMTRHFRWPIGTPAGRSCNRPSCRSSRRPGTPSRPSVTSCRTPRPRQRARVSAARVVLDTAIKAIELEDLEQRIVALEMQQGMAR